MHEQFEHYAISDAATINPSLTRTVSLSDEVSFIPMSDVSDTGRWVTRQTRKYHEVRAGYTAFENGDILFAKIIPCMENGKGCYVDRLVNGVGFGSTEFHVLRPKPGIDGRFVFYWLQTDMARKKAETFMIGSAGQQRVQRSFFDHFLVPKFSLSALRRIAEILDNIDEAIQKTEALIEKLKAMKQGLLHDLLTRGLNENGKLRDPKTHPEQFKDSPLGRIPNSWDIRSMGNTATLQRGFDLPLHKLKEGDVAVFGSNGIDGFHSNPRVEGPGVITGRTGTIGSVYYSEESYWPLNTTLYVKDFHGNYPKFVALLLESFGLQRFAAATGVPSLNRNFVHPLIVKVPKREEQEGIVAVSDVQEKRIEIEQESLHKLKLQKKGLMHELLTGKVRVRVTMEESRC
ncbi:MAG: restriction endonuclease subunit S [Deltaproteobacteria bacterium]|nr:restriction endonuclease subunit S [Deltaproteobacteria bacterium]